jgi:hypothetical protein
MKKLEAALDQVLEQALGKALASLEARATAIVEEALGAALEARLKALLGETAPAIEAPARAKAKATLTLKEEATPTLAQELGAILEGVEMALEKYRGITTPKGKELPDVLLRRIRKTLEHARALGRADLASLARSALAYIHADPKGVAMGSWQSLAAKLGLPIPVARA